MDAVRQTVRKDDQDQSMAAEGTAAHEKTDEPSDQRNVPVCCAPCCGASEMATIKTSVAVSTVSSVHQTSDMGELLLSMANIVPAYRVPPGMKLHRPRPPQKRRPRGHHAMLFVSIFCMIASEYTLTMELPARAQQFVGGIVLASSAGTMYLFVCYLVCGACDARAAEFGELLLARSNPLAWKRDQLRFFLEVCTWMASVWCSYTAFHSVWLSIAGGVLTAGGFAVCSDLGAAYVRVVEARINAEKKNALHRVAWLKMLLSYGCVGYVVTGHWQNVRVFLYSDVTGFQSVDDLVFHYLLITLVGVSLIVASELLLLFEPTRLIGMILQSRIVDARCNWEERTWRSLAEVTAVFGSTVVAFHITNDMLMSLQLGTLTGLVVILLGEMMSSTSLLSIVFAADTRDVIPADHWVKLIPLGVATIFVCYRVGVALVDFVTLPSSFSILLVWSLSVCAVSLTVVALTDNQYAVRLLTTAGRRFGGRLCMTGVTLVACTVCHGWVPVIFSGGLSWFCLTLSRECWNEIEAKEAKKTATAAAVAAEAAAVVVNKGRTLPLVRISHVDKPKSHDNLLKSWSSLVMRYFRKKYWYLYTRVKWTFIPIVILSIVDMCSTIVLLMILPRFEVSLSQFSAANVVISTGMGYLTSDIRRQLNPEVLVETGVRHFKNKWYIFPLHAFVESAVVFGVFIGTFTSTSTVFSSLTLALISGIVVSVGGHLVCSRFHVAVGNRARVQLTATCAIAFCVFLFTWVSFLCLFTIYHHIDSIEAAFCLASLSGVVFVASSELFLLWQPTREIGLILQCRVTHAKENWQAEPLRSFLELFTWFAVICGSFALYDDLLLALHVGTFSGVAVSLSGEYYRRNRSKLLRRWVTNNELYTVERSEIDSSPVQFMEQDKTDRPRVLPAMLLFAYIGSGTFHWIFENIRSLEMTALLASLAGFAFLCIADLLVLYKPTRWAGVILQDRFLRARENWNENPVRSFVELGCFFGVIYGSYAIYGDILVAIQVGTVSGTLVALIGDQLRCRARALPLSDCEDQTAENPQILPLPVMGLLGLVGAVAFNIIYTHLRSIEVAFVLATTSGVAFALLGDVFVFWKPTRKVGLILQERILYCQYNFKIHPARSWMEVISCALALYLSYEFLWPKDLLVAMQFGTCTGIMSCVCDELIMEYLTDFERKALQGAAQSQKASNIQDNSGLLSLPYEVQFEIAHFLSAEDLLVARATCHKINNMLRAESARYWLYSSLRRKFRIRQGSQIASRMRDQARSLIYDAIMVILPKLFSTRDPSEVLTSGIGVSRALKWVYLNADWIRSQNLAPLPSNHSEKIVTFHPGDVAFDVFRHMPDKSYLEITLSRNEDTSIKQIDVPVAVYAKIQTDPFSFVAAETLSEVDAFSNWHVAFVTFAAMTLIFIGQFSSDVLRQHILPASFWS